MKKLLFRIQQFVAVTEIEAKVFSVVLFLLFLGMGVRYAQAHWFVSEFEPVLASQDSLNTSSSVLFHPGSVDTTKSRRDSTDTVSVEASERGTEASTGLDINTASPAELQSLPGIGPALAGRIIEYRNHHGPFKTISDVMRVRGIGTKTLERLEALIVVNRP